MPQNDRHKEREIPIEFDFYNTLESLPVDNRCTIIMISCGSTTVKINEHIQTVTAPAVLCISQYDNFQCLERTHLSAKVFHFDPWYIKACLNFENLDDSVPIDKQYVYDRNMLYMFTKHHGYFQGIFNLTPQQYISHLISFDGFYNSIFFGFEAPKKFRCDFFVVNGCTRLFKQIVDNRRG